MTSAPPPPPPSSPPPPPPPPPLTPAPEQDDGWQRLDLRMLLVHPVREVLRFIIPAVGIFVAGSSSGGAPWQYLGVLVPVLLGVLRYLTTSYRVGTTRVELRRGLLNRRVVSAPIDRVRAVDLTASPIHRVLGLTTARIGTGTTTSDEDHDLELDGLPVERARELRATLLHESAAAGDPAHPADPSAPAGPAAVPAPDEPPVVRFDLGWLRFAPFTPAGVVVTAAALGAGAQVANELGLWDRVDLSDVSLGVPVWVAVVIAVVLLLLVVATLSVAGYLLTNWGFTVRRRRGAWHLTRGLLTVRETTVDVDRLAGVTVVDALPLRAVRGARLAAIVTGLDRKQTGSETLVPAAPRAVVREAAARVLGTPGPVEGGLRPHGPAARRRRLVRALVPAAALLALGGLVIVAGGPWWFAAPGVLAIAVALPLAQDRYASLGHALLERHVVARSGSLLRSRDALAVDHVIGWNLRATWFQRRAGLVTLVATTAGGRQSVTVLDVPEADAVAMAREAHPALVEQFLSAP